MSAHQGKLADLHTHLYGCIDSADFLAFLMDRKVNWTAYQDNFQKVYGYCPPIGEILERCRRSAVDGRSEFNRLFVFGDDDAGNFDRFQAKNTLNKLGWLWQSKGNRASAYIGMGI